MPAAGGRSATLAQVGGTNYSGLARIVLERASNARGGVELIGRLIDEYGEATYGGDSHLIADAGGARVVIEFAGGQSADPAPA